MPGSFFAPSAKAVQKSPDVIIRAFLLPAVSGLHGLRGVDRERTERGRFTVET